MDIKRITLGITNSYLLEGDEGYVMIDAGTIKQEKKFLHRIAHLGIKARQIKLIIITHAHFDHVGSLAAIKALCNNCPVLIHPLEAELLSTPVVAIPPGTNLQGKIISSLGRLNRPLLKFPPVTAEKIFDGQFDLNIYGIDGKVIHTPGHTPGSLSVLLGDGKAIVGDLAVNYKVSDIFPPFAVDPENLFASWNLLIKAGAKRIYPAHGSSFPVEKLLKSYDEHMKA